MSSPSSMVTVLLLLLHLLADTSTKRCSMIAEATNLVANGDFDDASYASWRYTLPASWSHCNTNYAVIPSGDAAWGSLVSESLNYHQGLQGHGACITQTLTFSSTGEYRLSLYASSRPGSNLASLTATIISNSDAAVSGTINTDHTGNLPDTRVWQYFSTDFSMTSGTATLKLLNSAGAGSGDGTVLIDSIAIERIHGIEVLDTSDASSRIVRMDPPDSDRYFRRAEKKRQVLDEQGDHFDVEVDVEGLVLQVPRAEAKAAEAGYECGEPQRDDDAADYSSRCAVGARDAFAEAKVASLFCKWWSATHK